MKNSFLLCRMYPAVLAVLLAGCGLLPASAPAATPNPVVTPGPALTPAPEPAATSTPEPQAAADAEVLDYDEMRSVAVYGTTPPTMMEGYFTVSKDGKWGLIRADGTELLPCLAPEPVANCGNGQHWMWTVPGMGWEEQDAWTARLEAQGEQGVCPGHGGSSLLFFYDLDAPGKDIHALDLSALRAYVSSDGPGNIVTVTDEMWETYGDLLPIFSAHEEGEEGDPRYPGSPVIAENGDGSTSKYRYVSREGWSFDVPNAQMACFFFDEPLAPVQKPGGWTYVDRSGNCLPGDTYYDPTYAAGPVQDSDNPATEPYYAAMLQNGYAAVRQMDSWGLLGPDGTEVKKKKKMGVAWDGTTLWIKQGDGWHQSELPG